MTTTMTRFARKRLIAWAIDVGIVVGIQRLCDGAMGLGWAASAGYWLIRDGCFEGQSIGKRLMGLKVVVGSSSARCTVKASVIRNLLWVVPIINLVMALNGLYAIITHATGRHWGDRLADTRVVVGSTN